jgi:uncharacterized protein YycO
MKYELVTIETKTGRFNIKATQEYNEFDTGHYRYCITDEDSNIVNVSQSMGAPPDGKIDKNFLKEKLDRFIVEYKHHQAVLAKVK